MKPEQEWAQLVPVPADRELPAGRHQQLKDHLMQEMLLDTGPAPARPRPTRKWAIAATATVIAGTIAAVVFTGSTTPAYAVQRQPNGALITIHDTARLAGLAAAAAGIGYPVTVVPMNASCTEPPPAPIPAGYEIYINSVSQTSASAEVVGAPLPKGEVVVLGIVSTPDMILIDGTITSHVPTCLPLPTR